MSNDMMMRIYERASARSTNYVGTLGRAEAMLKIIRENYDLTDHHAKMVNDTINRIEYVTDSKAMICRNCGDIKSLNLQTDTFWCEKCEEKNESK